MYKKATQVSTKAPEARRPDIGPRTPDKISLRGRDSSAQCTYTRS